MSDSLLVLKNVKYDLLQNNEQISLLKDINLTVRSGDFITILGSNGAGKSTLLNTISGDLKPTSGTISFKGQLQNNLSPEKRAHYLARVFQDPKLGTAPRMTVLENLLLARLRGEKRTLVFTNRKKYRSEFQKRLAIFGNNLENRLDTPVGQLSGGQRQALSLVMATIKKPELLLLDEHTAALDPKTSRILMELTNKVISQENLTALMITHQMEDALKYGNRLIVLSAGKIVHDYNKEEKANLNLQNLLSFFESE